MLDWTVRYWEKAKRAGLPVAADFGDVLPRLRVDGAAAPPQGARHLRAHPLPRRQERLPRGHAALRRATRARSPRATASSRRSRACSTARAARAGYGRRRDVGPAEPCRMKAMILAAGRGERMRPLTDRVPKALLEAGGRPLIVHLIERLARAGFADLVINVSHLGGSDRARRWATARASACASSIRASASALETAGGIAYALPLLGRRAVRGGQQRHLLRLRLRPARAPPRSGSRRGARARAPRAGGQSRPPSRRRFPPASTGKVAAAGGTRASRSAASAPTRRRCSRRSRAGAPCQLAALLRAGDGARAGERRAPSRAVDGRRHAGAPRRAGTRCWPAANRLDAAGSSRGALVARSRL